MADNLPYNSVTLLKNGHTHIFRYEPGSENDVAKLLLEKARDSSVSGLNYFDAAVLTLQIGRRYYEQLNDSIQ